VQILPGAIQKPAAALIDGFDAVPRSRVAYRSKANFGAMEGLLQKSKRAAPRFRIRTNFIAIAWRRRSKLGHLPVSTFELVASSR